jgi:hypothetical protein
VQYHIRPVGPEIVARKCQGRFTQVIDTTRTDGASDAVRRLSVVYKFRKSAASGVCVWEAVVIVEIGVCIIAAVVWWRFG